MTITFVGHGYVGLVTACVFADFGNKVWIIGRTPEKIKRLRAGDPIIYEPGLQEILQRNLEADRIVFSIDYSPAVQESDVVFITVGTPSLPDGSADLSAVFSVAKKIAENLNPDHFTVVSCKSTVPVGTNKKVEKIIKENLANQNSKFAVASCPEFLREGTAVNDTLNPDRIVIGSESQKAINMLIDLHSPLPGARVITDLASAELIKYTANAMLATKISFANLIAFYSEKTGADVEKVLDAVGLDKRIGRVFMNPGVGYGGSCFPKDVKALIATGKDLQIDTSLLESVDRVNTQARENFAKKIIGNVKKRKNIAILGIAFKPNTDDIREAPSIYIIDSLLKAGFQITVYDPQALENLRRIFGGRIDYADNPYQACEDKEAMILLTEWNEFRQIDLEKLKKVLRQPMIFDGRNIYNPEKMRSLGFKYFSIGRKPVI